MAFNWGSYQGLSWWNDAILTGRNKNFIYIHSHIDKIIGILFNILDTITIKFILPLRLCGITNDLRCTNSYVIYRLKFYTQSPIFAFLAKKLINSVQDRWRDSCISETKCSFFKLFFFEIFNFQYFIEVKKNLLSLRIQPLTSFLNKY